MWRAFHDAVTDPLARAGIPLAMTPGNHDGSAFAGFEEERRPYAEEWLSRRPGLRFTAPDTYPFFQAFDIGAASALELGYVAHLPLHYHGTCVTDLSGLAMPFRQSNSRCAKPIGVSSAGKATIPPSESRKRRGSAAMAGIIDIHPHVISPDTERYPLAPLGGTQSSWSAKHPITHEQLVAEMDAAGIDKAVVVQASTAYGHDNTYLAEAVAAHPDRLTGVFSVDVLAEDAVERIEYWRGRGLTGLRLFTAGSTMEGQANWLNDPRSHAAWAHAVKVGLPVCVQMRPPGIPLLRDLLDRFPEAVVVIDHLARPVLNDGPPYGAAQALWDLASYPGVHLKLTLRNILAAEEGASTVPSFMDHLVKTFGAERVAWGSNFPAAERPMPELVARAREAVSTLSPIEQAAILQGTAVKLYPALAAAHEGAMP